MIFLIKISQIFLKNFLKIFLKFAQYVRMVYRDIPQNVILFKTLPWFSIFFKNSRQNK